MSDQPLSERHGNMFPLFEISVADILRGPLMEGFQLTLVGGGVRLFLQRGRLPTDLDFEVRSEEEFGEEDWHKILQRWARHWSGKGLKVETLPFGILRLTLQGRDGVLHLELASPRMELFPLPGGSKAPDYSHKNFQAQVRANLPYQKSFARRDFTINAIGREFRLASADNTILEKWVDPFNGERDLQAGILQPCSGDFHRDPVRLLRAVRFELRDGLRMGEGLLQQLPLFNLSQLSATYFFREGMRSGDFLRFLRRCLQILDEKGIVPPAFSAELRRSAQACGDGKKVSDFAGYVGHLLCLEKKGVITVKDLRSLAPLMQISPLTLERLSRFQAQWDGPNLEGLKELELTIMSGTASEAFVQLSQKVSFQKLCLWFKATNALPRDPLNSKVVAELYERRADLRELLLSWGILAIDNTLQKGDPQAEEEILKLPNKERGPYMLFKLIRQFLLKNKKA